LPARRGDGPLGRLLLSVMLRRCDRRDADAIDLREVEVSRDEVSRVGTCRLDDDERDAVQLASALGPSLGGTHRAEPPRGCDARVHSPPSWTRRAARERSSASSSVRLPLDARSFWIDTIAASIATFFRAPASWRRTRSRAWIFFWSPAIFDS